MSREGGPRSALTELLRRPKVPPEWGVPFNIWVHDDNVSELELVVNPDLFPSVRQGDCLAITDHVQMKRIIVQVPRLDRGPFKQRSFQVRTPSSPSSPRQRPQVSIHRNLAERFGIKSRQNLYVCRLEASETPTVRALVVIFRDQHIGRVAMRMVCDQLRGRSTYTNKTLDIAGACRRARVLSLVGSDGKVFVHPCRVCVPEHNLTI